MNADSIKIECEEDGFHLVVTGDEPSEGQGVDGFYAWRITDPEALYDHVKATIGPWLRERDTAKIEYDRMKRANDTRLMDEQQFTEYLDDAYGDDWSKRVGMEQMREQGYA